MDYRTTSALFGFDSAIAGLENGVLDLESVRDEPGAKRGAERWEI